MGMEGKRTFPLPSGVVAETPVTGQINKKNEQNFINMCTSCIHGRYPGKSEEAPVVAQNSELNTILTGTGVGDIGLSGESK